MKSYFLSGNKKIIISTIITIFVLCNAATAVPYVYNSTNTKIIENQIDENEKIKERIFLDFINSMKNRFSNNKNSEFFNKLIDSFEKNPSEFYSIFENLFNTIPLDKAFFENGVRADQTFKNSILNILFNNNYNDENDQYSGFESWWDLYQRCLKLWSLWGFLPYEDYDSWYSSVKTIQIVLIPIVLLAYGSIIVSAESASILWMFLFVWEVYLLYFNLTYLLSSNLLVREVDIIIELKDKETGMPIEGIEVYATNLNATEQKDAGSEFTYLLEPFVNMGPGYYSLACRDREYKYCQPPTPPGTYYIEIPEGQYTQSKTYDGYEFTTNFDLMDAESYSFTIELESTYT